MNPIQAMENKMREANYASLNAARSALVEHPLAADYLLGVLVDRGVLHVTDDGAVVGRAVVPRDERRDPKEAVSSAWKETWPKRMSLVSWLQTDEPSEVVKFRTLQQNLKENGEVHSHWLVLHSLWNLIKAGTVENVRGGYRLTESGNALLAARREATISATTAALKKIGPPYDFGRFIEALASMPGHDMLDDGTDYIDQRFVDLCVETRIKTGVLPAN